MPEPIPTRSAYLELREEQRSMQEGYRFLDEKRLVLAGEIITQLQAYDRERAEFETRYRQALAALRGAVGRHGLEELQLYPPLHTPDARMTREQRSVLGVRVSTARLQPGAASSSTPVFASPEAETCRRRFLELLPAAVALAARGASLERLWQEYRRTSRRARALEDVLLPELVTDLSLIDASLEELDREEAVRVRHFRQHREA
jgi:V/A-type H+-transporting ATPase subunit D